MDAEDILEDLLVTLFEKTDLTIHVENLGAYIYRALYHKSIDWLRRRRPTVSLEGEEQLEIGDRAFDLTAVVESKEFKERLRMALDALDSRQRAVWVATEIDGYTFRELSQIWNEPIGTLLSRKSRANKALQNSLKDFQTVK
jgi:RNA polymerase sigma factor (sigma-70 family)